MSCTPLLTQATRLQRGPLPPFCRLSPGGPEPGKGGKRFGRMREVRDLLDLTGGASAWYPSCMTGKNKSNSPFASRVLSTACLRESRFCRGHRPLIVPCAKPLPAYMEPPTSRVFARQKPAPCDFVMSIGATVICILFLLAYTSAAQVLTTLHTFQGSDGAVPTGVTLSSNTFYGVTQNGGFSPDPGNGTIFRINTDGTDFVVLHKFDTNPDGAHPSGNLILSGIHYMAPQLTEALAVTEQSSRSIWMARDSP